jgi:hypothetical protein
MGFLEGVGIEEVRDAKSSALSRAVPGLASAGVLARVRQQGYVPRPLDGCRQAALVPRTDARLASWFDLAPVSDVLAQQRHILIVYVAHPVYTEGADLLATELVRSSATSSGIPSTSSRIPSLGQG